MSVLLFLFAFASLGWADIPPIPPVGKQFTIHSVQIQNLSAFPSYVIYAGNKGKMTGSYRIWDAQDTRPKVLANGAARNVGVTNPQFLLLTKKAYQSWYKHAKAVVDKQSADCDKGIGCIHVSQFVARYPVPQGVDCKVKLKVQTTSMKRQQFLTIYRLEKADENSCVLTKVSDTSR